MQGRREVSFEQSTPVDTIEAREATVSPASEAATRFLAETAFADSDTETKRVTRNQRIWAQYPDPKAVTIQDWTRC